MDNHACRQKGGSAGNGCEPAPLGKETKPECKKPVASDTLNDVCNYFAGKCVEVSLHVGAQIFSGFCMKDPSDDNNCVYDPAKFTGGLVDSMCQALNETQVRQLVQPVGTKDLILGYDTGSACKQGTIIGCPMWSPNEPTTFKINEMPKFCEMK